jgi:hypothetical protein
MRLFDFHSSEGLFNEHKEFTLSPDSIKNFSGEDMERYIKGDIDDILFDVILENIERYVIKYFPKCYSCFMNTKKSNELNGYLNIGMTDEGYISGIPILNFEENKFLIEQRIKCQFQKIIDKSILISVDSNDLLSLDDLNVEIEMIPLDYNDFVDDNNPVKLTVKQVKDHINNFERQRQQEKEEYERYLKEFRAWNQRLSKYNCKLILVLEDQNVRREFIDFILTNHSGSILQSLPETYHHMILTDYLSRTIIITYDDFCRIIRLFRDDNQTRIISVKPQRPGRRSTSINPKMFPLIRLTPYIEEFVKNPDVTYILLRLKISLNNQRQIAYMTTKNGMYNVKRRFNRLINGIQSPQSGEFDLKSYQK